MPGIEVDPKDIRHAIICYLAFHNACKLEDQAERDISTRVWAIECHKVAHVYKACGMQHFAYEVYLPKETKDEIAKEN